MVGVAAGSAMSQQLFIPILPGKIVELHERIFYIEQCHYEGGELTSMTARCLTPQDGDTSEWFTLEVSDEDLIVAYTIH